MTNQEMTKEYSRILCHFCRQGLPAVQGDGLSVAANGDYSYVGWCHRFVSAEDDSVRHDVVCGASLLLARSRGYFQWQGRHQNPPALIFDNTVSL